MMFARQVPQALDAEHRASLDLLGRLEAAALDGDSAALARVAAPLARQLEHEVGRHFDFEEHELFVRMAQAGDGALAELLAEEHATIREVAGELLAMVREAGTDDWPGETATAFRRLSLELVDRMVAHIQKETMGLLPLLDDLLDEANDRELAFAYAAG